MIRGASMPMGENVRHQPAIEEKERLDWGKKGKWEGKRAPS